MKQQQLGRARVAAVTFGGFLFKKVCHPSLLTSLNGKMSGNLKLSCKKHKSCNGFSAALTTFVHLPFMDSSVLVRFQNRQIRLKWTLKLSQEKV